MFFHVLQITADKNYDARFENSGFLSTFATNLVAIYFANITI